MNLNKITTPRSMVVIIDSIITLISIFIAFLVRFNFKIPENEIDSLKYSLALIFILRFISFFYKKRYKNLARYTTTKDIENIFIVTLLASILIGAINLVSHYLLGYKFITPFSVLIIEFLFSILCFILYRLVAKVLVSDNKVNKNKAQQNVIIYGANDNAIVIKSSLEKDTSSAYKILAFLSDNKTMIGKKIMNIPILSDNKLNELLSKNKVAFLINSKVTIINTKLNELTNICLQNNVKILTIPPIDKWINKELSFKQIKGVKIEDLLERKEVFLNKDKVQKRLTNKIVLVTGAAGSIGSELSEQIASFNPKQLLLLDQSESALYTLELTLRKLYPKINIEIIIGDIRNKDRLEKLFSLFQIQIVFHAAAYKHVPLMEEAVYEALNTNVFGSKTLIDVAINYNIEQFIFISTDKAIRPTSVMGASKRITEIYIKSIQEKCLNTKFTITRFGNVLGSNGSVIPRFRKQIENIEPITVTHPEITRYFMTIPEACQLVLEASIGETGQIFVFDMGKSMKIVDLAKKMVKLSGLELEKDIKIIFTGLRAGEKLYEELSYENEDTIPAHHPKIMISKATQETIPSLFEEMDLLKKSLTSQNNKTMVRIMKQIVPEYKSQNSIYQTLDDGNK